MRIQGTWWRPNKSNGVENCRRVRRAGEKLAPLWIGLAIFVKRAIYLFYLYLWAPNDRFLIQC